MKGFVGKSLRPNESMVVVTLAATPSGNKVSWNEEENAQHQGEVAGGVEEMSDDLSADTSHNDHSTDGGSADVTDTPDHRDRYECDG